MELVGYGLLALVAAALGALGGLGGAILLVPVLVVTGMPASDAAPLGLLTVAAGSVAAGGRQVVGRLVNHRLGMAMELLAAAGAVVGANLSGLVSERVLTLFLAAIAFAAAAAGMATRGRALRNPPDPACTPSDIGERVGRLSGAYPLGDGIVPYTPRRLRLGLSLMGLAGFIAGTAGVSGGFIKTPATTQIMGVPMKVAAATSTFTVGITASVALVVFAIQGRIVVEAGTWIVAGSLVGGQVGSHLQSRLPPWVIRRVLSGLLVVISVVLVVRS